MATAVIPPGKTGAPGSALRRSGPGLRRVRHASRRAPDRRRIRRRSARPSGFVPPNPNCRGGRDPPAAPPKPIAAQLRWARRDPPKPGARTRQPKRRRVITAPAAATGPGGQRSRTQALKRPFSLAFGSLQPGPLMGSVRAGEPASLRPCSAKVTGPRPGSASAHTQVPTNRWLAGSFRRAKRRFGSASWRSSARRPNRPACLPAPARSGGET